MRIFSYIVILNEEVVRVTRNLYPEGYKRITGNTPYRGSVLAFKSQFSRCLKIKSFNEISLACFFVNLS